MPQYFAAGIDAYLWATPTPSRAEDVPIPSTETRGQDAITGGKGEETNGKTLGERVICDRHGYRTAFLGSHQTVPFFLVEVTALPCHTDTRTQDAQDALDEPPHRVDLVIEMRNPATPSPHSMISKVEILINGELVSWHLVHHDEMTEGKRERSKISRTSLSQFLNKYFDRVRGPSCTGTTAQGQTSTRTLHDQWQAVGMVLKTDVCMRGVDKHGQMPPIGSYIASLADHPFAEGLMESPSSASNRIPLFVDVVVSSVRAITSAAPVSTTKSQAVAEKQHFSRRHKQSEDAEAKRGQELASYMSPVGDIRKSEALRTTNPRQVAGPRKFCHQILVSPERHGTNDRPQAQIQSNRGPFQSISSPQRDKTAHPIPGHDSSSKNEKTQHPIMSTQAVTPSKNFGPFRSIFVSPPKRIDTSRAGSMRPPSPKKRTDEVFQKNDMQSPLPRKRRKRQDSLQAGVQSFEDSMVVSGEQSPTLSRKMRNLTCDPSSTSSAASSQSKFTPQNASPGSVTNTNFPDLPAVRPFWLNTVPAMGYRAVPILPKPPGLDMFRSIEQHRNDAKPNPPNPFVTAPNGARSIAEQSTVEPSKAKPRQIGRGRRRVSARIQEQAKNASPSAARYKKQVKTAGPKSDASSTPLSRDVLALNKTDRGLKIKALLPRLHTAAQISALHGEEEARGMPKSRVRAMTESRSFAGGMPDAEKEGLGMESSAAGIISLSSRESEMGYEEEDVICGFRFLVI